MLDGRIPTVDHDEHDRHDAHRSPWVPMVMVMAGTIMVVLDSTIVNVALHQIGVALGASTGVEWVVTAYLLAVCAAQPVTGWLANRRSDRGACQVVRWTFSTRLNGQRSLHAVGGVRRHSDSNCGSLERTRKTER